TSSRPGPGARASRPTRRTASTGPSRRAGPTPHATRTRRRTRRRAVARGRLPLRTGARSGAASSPERWNGTPRPRGYQLRGSRRAGAPSYAAEGCRWGTTRSAGTADESAHPAQEPRRVSIRWWSARAVRRPRRRRRVRTERRLGARTAAWCLPGVGGPRSATVREPYHIIRNSYYL